MKRSTLVILIIVIAAAVGGYFLYRNFRNRQAASLASYQTVKLSRGTLTSLVGATGTVRANQTATMIWQTSGTVAQVLVHEGDKVTAGQPLANLDKTSLPQTVIMAESDLVTAQRNLDNLRNSTAARANAQQTLANAQKAVDDAQKKVDSKSYTLASQDVIDTAYANYILAQNTVDQKQQIFDGVSFKPDDDPNRAAALSDLAAAKQRRDIALANYNQAKSKPDQIDVNIAQANLDLAKANLKDAQREWDRLKNGVDPNDIAAAQAKVDSIQATLGLSVIKAPFGGTVTDAISTIGDEVTPQTKAFRIDDLSRMLIDVQITEVDINRIQNGQPVNITFDAIPDKNYTGKVSDVGRVGTTVQGVVNFTVTVELADADANVRPGMTAAVNIVVDQLNDVLVVPNRAVKVNQGNRVVYIMKNNRPTAVTITIGATSDTNSQIVKGEVKEGDLVVLNPPAATFSGFGPGGGGGFRAGGGGGGGGNGSGGNSSGGGTGQ